MGSREDPDIKREKQGAWIPCVDLATALNKNHSPLFRCRGKKKKEKQHGKKQKRENERKKKNDEKWFLVVGMRG